MPQPSAAFFEDADEDGNVVTASRKYAKSTAASTTGSPVRQLMNTGKKKSSRRTELSSPDESDSTEHASGSSRHKTKEKRQSVSRSKGKEPEKQRPVVRSSKTTPSRTRHHDDASYYGVTDPQTIPASSRPRALSNRPQTYYGQRPPLSQSAYYPPGPQGPPGSYTVPPPPWMGPPLGSSPLASSPMGHPDDYFAHGPDPLANRFSRGETQRPTSAMGHRVGSYAAPSTYEHYERPPPPQKLVARQPSVSKRPSKDKEDRKRMPPPPTRPQTTQPRQVFKPPPPQLQNHYPRKSVGFDDDELSMAESYDDRRGDDRRGSIDFTKIPIRSKRQSQGPDYFEGGEYSLETAATKPSRRENRRSASYSLADKMGNASKYQEEVTGGNGAALTNENLKRIKNGGSSRSTRSSASRDESSFKQSTVTRTTRSSSNDDDITIKVPSGAVVEVGNAKINCTNGGEINIGRSDRGSDRGSTLYDEELRSRAPRLERPANRAPTSSQSVHSRRPRALPSPYPEDNAYYSEHHEHSYSDQHTPQYPYHRYEYAPPYPGHYPGTEPHYDSDDD